MDSGVLQEIGGGMGALVEGGESLEIIFLLQSWPQGPVLPQPVPQQKSRMETSLSTS